MAQLRRELFTLLTFYAAFAERQYTGLRQYRVKVQIILGCRIALRARSDRIQLFGKCWNWFLLERNLDGNMEAIAKT